TEGASPEIWAWGLRNPWRFSFDRETGDLYIADVGQGVYEEVSLAPAGQGGLNFGWNPKEGPGCYAIDPCDDPEFVDPFFWYSHDEGGCSITGGYVYRGEAIANLAGVYLAADYCSGLVWAVDPATGNVAGPLESGMAISSFAEDAEGEVYILDHNGAMYRITG
ncbi:MAG: PQQ-dependent sugar dehydrogenase, partial [Chloroflexota bacterium]|nr:PQQ-dependent sugar dehydrogenase [Chloroflexota bacterium]